MAAVSVWTAFADGDQLAVRIEVPTNYPDALDEACSQAHDLFGASLETYLDSVLPDAPDEV